MDIGTRIRELRRAQGLGQAEASAAAGILPGAWSLIETNKRQATLRTLEGIAAALGVTLAYMVDPDNAARPDGAEPEPEQTGECQ